MLLTFLGLIMMMGIIGGTGLVCSRRIQRLFDQMTPLLSASTELQHALIAYLTLFNAQDERQFQEHQTALTTLQQSFQHTQTLLANVQAETEEDFFEQARTSINAYQQMLQLQQETMLEQKYEAFRKQRQELDQIVGELGDRGKANINQKEDVGRTLEQSGSATPEDFVTLLVDLFETDYPVVEGTFSLERYLIQLEDLANIYITEQLATNLPRIEEDFTRTLN